MGVDPVSDRDISEGLERIAIIGMAGRFPGARSIAEYWANLVAGVESVRRLSREEMLAAGVSQQQLDKDGYVNASGVLDDVEWFDPGFFGFTASEAEVMDPQQRIALECAWEVFENAGYPPGETPGRTAVFLGAGLSTYLLHNLIRRPEVFRRVGGLRVLIGNDKDHVPLIISYALNLRGPSINVNTACSTSLVAISLACQSLWSYQADLALAGGVSVQVPQRQGYQYQTGGVYSPDGHCRPFDHHAQGTVGGSGAGLLLLKRLPDAIRDGDHIYAAIAGAAINNDGATKVGYTAPSVSGQAEVIRQAMAIAGVMPGQISYVEAHGTGTALGDPIEVAALKEAFDGCAGEDFQCALASVKGNIGHLDVAAGIASVIKTALALKNHIIPASLHFEKPNLELHLENSPFYIPRETCTWPKAALPRRAGVSSFGIGGTNAHIVLEECSSAVLPGVTPPSHLLVLSARSNRALGQMALDLADYLERHPEIPMANVAFSLGVGRRVFEFRRSVLVSGSTDAVHKLRLLSPEESRPVVSRECVFWVSTSVTHAEAAVSELEVFEPDFHKWHESCLALVSGKSFSDLGLSLSIQYAVAMLWRSWGTRPVAAFGSAAAPFLLAAVAGECSLEDSIQGIAAAYRLSGGDSFNERDGIILDLAPASWTSLMQMAGQAWTEGASIDWMRFHGHRCRQRVPLPTYPFERKYYWLDRPQEEQPSARSIPMDRLNALHRKLEGGIAVRTLDDYAGLRARLPELCLSHAYWFVRSRGLAAPGERRGRSEFEAALCTQPAYRRLAGYLTDMLIKEGIMRVLPSGSVYTPGDEPAHPDEIGATAIRDYPEFRGLIELLDYCVSHYGALMDGHTTGAEVLYGDGSGEFLERSLVERTVEHGGRQFYARVAAEWIAEIAAERNQPLRILEVGIGGGGLTREMAAVLPSANVDYLATDISQAFLGRVEAEAVRRGLNHFRFGLLDISFHPQAQGFQSESFDVILAMDVFHATPSLSETLGHLSSLLVPGGLLCFVETVQPDFWTNMIWGTSESWWLYRDGLRESVPLLTAEKWKDLLPQCGFENVVSLANVGSRNTEAAMFAAQKSKNVEEQFAPLPPKQSSISDWFWVPDWERVSRTASGELPQAGPWLIFRDASGVCGPLEAELRSRGETVISVSVATQSSRLDGLTCDLNPAQAGQYSELIAAQVAEGNTPRGIVHCWAVSRPGDGDAIDPLASSQDTGLFSLLELAKALATHAPNHPVDLIICASGLHDVLGDETLVPARATLLAAAKIIPREYPNLRCVSVDLPATVGAFPAALVRAFLDDGLPFDEPVLAWRGTHIWKPVYHRLAHGNGGRPPLRSGGVYLVLGGLGSIGLTLAHYLAQTPGARIVLVSRTPLPENWRSEQATANSRLRRQIGKLRAIEASGADILLRTADITDETQMRQVLAEIDERYGGLHGIVHAAGVPDKGGIIQLRDRESTEGALAAKVRGVQILDKLLGDRTLDFLMLCSSIGAILYRLKFGEVGYVAANDFLNAFAHEFSRRGRGRCIAINWTDWLEGGMWAEAHQQLRTKYGSGMRESNPSAEDLLHGITDAEGEEVFGRLLPLTFPQVVVSTQDFAQLLERHSGFTTESHRRYVDAMNLARPAHERRATAGYCPPRTLTEQRLTAIWQDVLGIDRVGMEEDFFELGGDSLLAIRIVNRLREEFGVDQALASLLEVRTIGALASRVDQLRHATGGTVTYTI